MPVSAAAVPGRCFRRRFLAAVLTAVALAAALATAGCGSRSAGSGPSGPEKPDIVIGALPAIGSAGIWIALDEGLFAKAGLHVTVEQLGAPPTVIPALKHGEIDVLEYQWTTVIAAEAAGVARLHAIAAAQSLGPRSHEILVLPHSGITTLAQLKGKTIGIQSLDGLDTILVDSTLAADGISPSQVHLVAVPFQGMETALAARRVDAVEPAEPFVTLLEEKLGAEPLADMDQGATADFPVAGYTVTDQFLAKYPRTAAALARVLDQAEAIASTNRAALERAMVQDAHVSTGVAALVNAGTFPDTVDPVQLQRVANAMYASHELSHPFNIRALTG
jgi:NitT/TauT family transport system substrate-binding protein